MTPAERRAGQALLVAEGAALASLRATITATTSDGASRSTLPALAARVEAEALTTVRNARLGAKRVGNRTMRVELSDVLGRPVTLRDDIPLERDEEKRVADDAAALAEGARLLGGRGLESSSRVSGPMLAKALDGRVRRIAAAQAGEGFNRERDDAAAEFARSEEGLFLPVILRRWNAMLDACPVCKRLDGQSRPLGIDYEGGQRPGAVHPFCRCFSTILPIPLYLRAAA